MDNPELKKTLDQLQKNFTGKTHDVYKKFVYKLATSKEGEIQHTLAKSALAFLGIVGVSITREKIVWQDMSGTTTVLAGIIRLTTKDGNIIHYGIRETSPLTIKRLYEIRPSEPPINKKSP